MRLKIKGVIGYLIIVVIFLSFFSEGKAQSPVSVSGYISEMPSFSWEKKGGQTLLDNLIHNRIKLGFEPNPNLNVRLEIRNRIFWGETVNATPLYKFFIDNDQGWVDMSFNWGSGKSYLVNTVIDRLSLERIWGKFQVRVGRQRVNWSQSNVWNPNDIFNSYSYFDFDYPERPGMDGVRMQYYTGVSSRLEAVLKMDGNNHLTSALLYGFNKIGYDIQLIAGQVTQDDLILGLGWGGNIADAGFYGEFSFLSPFQDKLDNIYLMSVGASYTFKNSLTLTGEYLYSSNLNSSFKDFKNVSLTSSSIKELSVTDNSYMLSLSFPVNPLLNVSLSYVGFSYPVFKNFYIAPNVEYSIKDNLFITGVFQLYSQTSKTGDQLSISSFIRLKKVF